MNSKHLHELIDSCRPGHADVDQPEFSELARELTQDPSLQRLFERSQELDEGIRTAFQSVTPPPGLAERLLEAIETPTIETPAIERGEASPAAAETKSHVELARRPSRRSVGIWAGVVSLAAVAAMITVLFQGPHRISPSTDREIAEIVDQWNAEMDQTPWQTTANIPSQDFPTWQHLKIGGDDRWQWVSKGQSVCYDFASNHEKVRLFVIKQSPSVALPTAPPAGYPSPEGWHVGAWQANGRVYYLAVQAEGDSKRLYNRVISAPLA
jgi:negative regulator of sigma E activity